MHKSGQSDTWLRVHCDDGKNLISHLDHDKFPLSGPPVRPLLSKTQTDFKLREAWCLATLVGYHPCTRQKHTCITIEKKTENWKKKKLFIYGSEPTKIEVQTVQIKVITVLTTKKRLQAKQFDLFLALYKIWLSLVWSTGARPVHLTLAETDRIDVMAADFQD